MMLLSWTTRKRLLQYLLPQNNILFCYIVKPHFNKLQTLLKCGFDFLFISKQKFRDEKNASPQSPYKQNEKSTLKFRPCYISFVWVFCPVIVITKGGGILAPPFRRGNDLWRGLIIFVSFFNTLSRFLIYVSDSFLLFGFLFGLLRFIAWTATLLLNKYSK